MSRILSTFPATGWYVSIDGEATGMNQFYSPLVCWALIEEDDGSQEIVGMMATDEVVVADEFDGFMSYVHESELVREKGDGKQ